MPTNEQIKAAGGNDVGEWGEANMDGLYPDGYEMEINGTKFKPAAQPDVVGGENSPSPPGDLDDTALEDPGDFGDLYESVCGPTLAPLRG